VTVQAGEEGVRLLLVSGRRLREPVAWYGPIVMNTQAELRQAVAELENGTFIEQPSGTVVDGGFRRPLCLARRRRPVVPNASAVACGNRRASTAEWRRVRCGCNLRWKRNFQVRGNGGGHEDDDKAAGRAAMRRGAGSRPTFGNGAGSDSDPHASACRLRRTWGPG
jgi:Pirin C-terminal cupin domain